MIFRLHDSLRGLNLIGMVRKIELKSISKPEDVKSYIENDNELKDYKIMYVGMSSDIIKRLDEHCDGISGKKSRTDSLIRSVVRDMNETLPFDNIVRTYINTGIFVYFESKEAAKMEEVLIKKILKPKLNKKGGGGAEGNFVYLFLHKHTPGEFLKIHFPKLENMKEYILKRCFELNPEGLPYDEEQAQDEEQKVLNSHSELKTNGSY